MVSEKWDYGGYKLSTNRMFGMKKRGRLSTGGLSFSVLDAELFDHYLAINRALIDEAVNVDGDRIVICDACDLVIGAAITDEVRVSAGRVFCAVINHSNIIRQIRI